MLPDTDVNTPTHAGSSDFVSTQCDTPTQAVSDQSPKQIEQHPNGSGSGIDCEELPKKLENSGIDTNTNTTTTTTTS